MADLIDALYTLARQRGRNENPLLALRSFAGRVGARISHLPIHPALAQAWPGATGEPFHQHQALALAALRREEAVALLGGVSAHRSMHLLVIETLHATHGARVLLVAPDELAAMAHVRELRRLVRDLKQPLHVALAAGTGVRAALNAQVVVTTPELLHDRLLRHHARAWGAFWAKLRLVALAEVHSYPGPAAVHLAALLLRLRRLVPTAPLLLATLVPLEGADRVLAQIGACPWRMVSAEDTPSVGTTLALWRTPGERARESLALALGLARTNARVHLLCPGFEAPLLRLLAGADFPSLSIGLSTLPADVQVIMGLNEAAAPLAQAHDGPALSVLVIGDDPAERALARLAQAEHEQSTLPLLDGTPLQWVATPINAYIEAQHLLCAATERPISGDEAHAWGVEPLIERLSQQERMLRLPGRTTLWQPLPSAGDVYAGFDLRSVAGMPALLADDQGHPLGLLDQATFDRWAFLGAALPPLRGGYRVVTRQEDDDRLELTISASAETRRTLPLRRCEIQVRDRREYRVLRGCDLAWGRVIVDEELYGFREAAPGVAPNERVINPPIALRWSAPALWIDLPIAVKTVGQLVGWSLVAALPLCTSSNVTDLVPAYDHEVDRIYFVDTHPGGNGLAGWLFAALERILPLAYDVALECRNDPLLEALARADMDWLLALLGGKFTPPAPVPPLAAPSRLGAPSEPPVLEPTPQVPAPQPKPPPVPPPPAPTAAPKPASARRAAAQPTQATTPPAEPPAPPAEPKGRQSRSKRQPKRKAAEQPAAESTPPAPPPTLPPVPPPDPPDSILPDAAAMVARLQRLRQQREQQHAPQPTRQNPATQSNAAPRFQTGDQITCNPYGRGQVVASRIENDHELLVVLFPEHGQLTIDAAVSAVRLVEEGGNRR